MKGKILLFTFLFTFLITFASAADVAYLYKKEFKVDQNIIDVFNELGMSVELINDRDIPRTDFDEFHVIFVGDELFKQVGSIPVHLKPTVVASGWQANELGLTDFDQASAISSSGGTPLEVRKNGREIQVYTQNRYRVGSGPAIPYFYLDDLNKVEGMMSVAREVVGVNTEKENGDVISYADAGIRLGNGRTTQAKLCYFGIIESDFWTPAARQMFLECVQHVSITCSSNLDCPDMNLGGPYCRDGDTYQDVGEFVCENPGTVASACVDDVRTDLVDECGEGSVGDWGDGYCYLGNVYHNRTVEARGCSFGSCTFDTYEETDLLEVCSNFCMNGECVDVECVEDTDCSPGFSSNDYCIGDDVYKDVHDFSCTHTFECREDVGTELVRDCGEDSFGDWGDNFCIGDAVYHNRTNWDRGCSVGQCFSNPDPETVLVRECEDSCVDGACVTEKIHDVALIDFTNSVDQILLEYTNGTDILSRNPVLSCNDVIKTKVRVENKGDFVEDIVMRGDLSGTAFSLNTIDDSQPGDTNFRSSLSPYISLEGLSGTYTVTVEAIISNDANPSDNTATRGITVVCAECRHDSDCRDDFYSDNFCLYDTVYQNFTDVSCVQGSCVEDTSRRLVEECSDMCVEGACTTTKECTMDSECGTDYYSANYCTGDKVYRDFHDFSCTENYECREDITPELVEMCSDSCANGACVEIECHVNTDCGINMFTGNPYCSEYGVYEDFISHVCENPGTVDSFCFNYTLPVHTEQCDGECISGECVSCLSDLECGVDGFVGDNYCIGDDVYRNYEDVGCELPGTELSMCVSEVAPRLIEECADTCVDGGCIETRECTTDSQCGLDYYSEKYCSEGGVYEDFHDFSCTENYKCRETVIPELVDSCVGSGDVEHMRVSGENEFLGEELYIHLSRDGLLGPAPNGFGQKHDLVAVKGDEGFAFTPKLPSDSVGDLTEDDAITEDDLMMLRARVYYGFELSPSQSEAADVTLDGVIDATDVTLLRDHVRTLERMTSGSTSFFIEYDLSDELGNTSSVHLENSSLHITLRDIDFKPVVDNRHSWVETATIVFIADGPTNPETPGDFVVPSSAPRVILNESTYLGYQKNGPVVQTNEAEIEYEIMIPQAIMEDVMEDKSFSVYVTLQVDILAFIERTIPNGPESFSLSDIVFTATSSSPLPEVCTLCFGECRTDFECNDGNSSTIDTCELAGNPDSFCTHTPVNCVVDAHCGITGFVGAEYCSFDDVYKNYSRATCIHPGTVDSFCDVSFEPRAIVDCGEDEFGNWSEPFCSESGLNRSRIITEMGCSEAACFDRPLLETETLEACEFGCEVDMCLEPECRENSDCLDDYFNATYCVENSTVYQDFHNFSCVNFECVEDVTPELVYECGDDEVGEWGAFYCDGDHVSQNRTLRFRGCETGMCTQDDQLEFNRSLCEFGCSLGQCLEPECRGDSDCSHLDSQFCSEDRQIMQEGVCVQNSCEAQEAENLSCGDDSCDVEIFYCVGDSVYANETCYERGCGGLDSSCFVTSNETSRFVQDCSFGCSDGVCLNECETDTDCDHLDSRMCSDNHEVIVEGFCESNSCVPREVENIDCSADYCDPWSEPVCVGGNSQIQRTCYTGVCEIDTSMCMLNGHIETNTTECLFGCTNGMCDVPECVDDSDCDVDSYGENYCSENGVVRDFTDNFCEDNICKSTVSQEPVEQCGVDRCDPFGVPFCIGDDLYREQTCYEAGCDTSINECFEIDYINQSFITTCEHGCENGICKGFIPTDTPVDIMLVLDNSGSINEEEFSDLLNASISLVQALGPSSNTSNIGISFFNTEGSDYLDLTSSEPEIVSALESFPNSDGATHLQGGMLYALHELLGPRNRASAPDYFIIITDGVANRYYSVDGVNNRSMKDIDEIVSDLSNFLGSNPEQFSVGNSPPLSFDAADVAVLTADAVDEAGIGIFVLGVGIQSFSFEEILREDIATDEAFYYDVDDYAQLEERLLEIIGQ